MCINAYTSSHERVRIRFCQCPHPRRTQHGRHQTVFLGRAHLGDPASSDINCRPLQRLHCTGALVPRSHRVYLVLRSQVPHRQTQVWCDKRLKSPRKDTDAGTPDRKGFRGTQLHHVEPLGIQGTPELSGHLDIFHNSYHPIAGAGSRVCEVLMTAEFEYKRTKA